jgi:hypothetical protein
MLHSGHVMDAIMQGLLQHGNVTLSNVVLIAMHIVEVVSSEKLVGSREKLNRARALLPSIIQELLEKGEIDDRQAASLTAGAAAVEQVSGIIETIIAVSKNPTLVQLRERAAEACCAGKRRRN